MCDLTNAQIQRYGRQLLVPSIGVDGQRKLCRASVLIVGAGGLGSPAALYLAGAGAGTIGIVDGDIVETSNLHRQIMHSEAAAAAHLEKVKSAKEAVHRLNSTVNFIEFATRLTCENAFDIIGKFDVVLDATDNAPSRYLINDACVMLRKPLVSGSALKLEGQLTVYGYNGGPCQRCIFPTPPQVAGSCADNGVLGIVPGLIGSFQALEAIKIITGVGEVCSGHLMMFDALSLGTKLVKLPGRRKNCAICGDEPRIRTLQLSEAKCHEDDSIAPVPCMSCEELQHAITKGSPHILLDVRSATEFAICRLPQAINIPLANLQLEIPTVLSLVCVGLPEEKEVYVICRRGRDSKTATKVLLAQGISKVCNVDGGLNQWCAVIDKDFPTY